MAQPKPYIYIALEGLDGTGKTTLYHNLVALFDEHNISIQTLCPTQIYSPKSIVERIYKANKCFKKIDIFRTIIFAYRSNLASSKINWCSPNLIIGDRSVVVSYVKQWKKYFNSASFSVALINLIEPLINPPDYVFVLKAPMDVVLHRISQKKIIEIDETPENLLRMESAYHEIRNIYKIKRLVKTEWIDINSDKNPDSLAKEVFNIINELMSKATM